MNDEIFSSKKSPGKARLHPENKLLVGRQSLLFSRREAADQLSLSLRSVAYLIADGRLRTRRIGGRVFIPRDELLRFASKDHREPVVPAA